MQVEIGKFFSLWILVMLLQSSICFAAVDRGNGKEIFVLSYHKIDYYANDMALAIPPEDFRLQMKFLMDNMYHSITPTELVQYLKGKGNLPERPVLITFDDGYEDNYKNAFPILKEFGFKATIFIITDFMGKENYLTWEEAKEMLDYGISIESHTKSHVPLTPLSRHLIRQELTLSKEKIREKLGVGASFLAYPEGYYNRITENIVKECGYEAAFTVRYGAVDNKSELFALERIPIFRSGNTIEDFRRRLHYASNYERTGWVLP